MSNPRSTVAANSSAARMNAWVQIGAQHAHFNLDTIPTKLDAELDAELDLRKNRDDNSSMASQTLDEKGEDIWVAVERPASDRKRGGISDDPWNGVGQTCLQNGSAQIRDAELQSLNTLSKRAQHGTDKTA